MPSAGIHHFGAEARHHTDVRTEVRYRVVVAGAELRMLVLSADRSGAIGVDLESGAFVRTHWPVPPTERIVALDVVAAEIAGTPDPPDPACPEAVELAGAPRPAGRFTPRKAERYLAALHHPRRLPVLGFPGVSIPYWKLEGDRPSVALLDAAGGPEIHPGPSGLECRFGWAGEIHQYPLADRGLNARLTAMGVQRLGSRDLTRLLEYRPRRLVVALTSPVDGYCHKTVAALLPTR